MSYRWDNPDPRDRRPGDWDPPPLPWWAHLLIGFILGCAVTYLAMTPFMGG
jgi:hypothetical protein